ncbi:chromosomal replication initiator protein DnaA [Sulfuriferula plumbiphila]|uniref:Chromosomal replication initiator protein DnaA n=1 Tax=Sulfuriferula plumbiphila TaxID=171865 RepID=A0A512L330_9PROT|nr:chromosomal replication initiator protein DnaA [Sulfuriferula plumbiphila]BBP02579.1 chromosomal replication initiator protein DnaA [Sulfuriferula plumbiphila]GEP28873.1 chromosomal replication initiator protein DnaA [Sulfuriferula plumbiphila]
MNEFWQSCLNHLAEDLPPQQFNTWIKPLKPALDGDSFRLLAPNRFVLDWVKEKFLVRIEGLALAYFGEPKEINLGLSEQVISSPRPVLATAPAGAVASPVVTPATSQRESPKRLNPTFTFDSFVTGKANQLARAAAIQVAENPGTAYNPLFIYGGVGLGKTHLIQAIGNVVHAYNPEARISYIHAENYVSDVVRAYRHKTFDDFKRHYHSLDLLLIDDIQFFNGKGRTQEEFFYAFNALIEARKQVIITCDTYPKEIAGMEDRLKSRFGWGLTVAIEPPELEMRVAILLKKAAAEGIVLEENIAFFIAKQVRSNVRELEGALKRVFAYARFSARNISLDLVKESLKDLLAVQSRQVSIENIQKTVADFYKIKVVEMYSKKRTRSLVRPRQMAMSLAKELTSLSLPDIGEAFGGRDHTTVLHACRKIIELKEQDATMSREYALLLQVLTS